MIINPERDFLLNQEPDQQQGTKDDCHAAKPFDLNWMLSAAADPDLDSLYKSQRTQVETDEDDNRLEHSTENCLVSFTVDPTIESCHQELQAKPEIGTTAREKVFREMFSYRSGTLDALEILPALQIVSHQLQPKRSFDFPEFPERKNIPSPEIPAGKSVVIDGADKSKLHFSNPDGKPIVDKIEFADANHTEAIYSYDKQGNLTGVTMRQGTKTILDVTQKGDKVLVSSSGSDQKPIELAGNLAMLPDGTWQIKGTTAIECYPDGTLVNSRSGNDKNAFVSVTTTDGTSYTGIRKPDGTASIRSWSGNLDGLGHSVVTYIYGQDKAEPDSIVVSSQGSMDLYQKGKEDADGVPQWLHKSRSVVGQSCDVNTRAIVNDKFPPVPESVKENPEALAIPTTLRDQRYVVEVQASFLQHNQDILQFKKAAVTQQVKAELENDIATGKISPKSGEELPALVKSRVADAFKAMEQEHKKLIDEVKKEAQSLGEKQTGWDKLPATRKAYELTLSWLNEQALPKTYVVLDKLGGVVGANCPLAETAAAKGMSRSEYQKMLEDLVHGNLKGKVLDLDEKQVPSTQDVARMERAVRFVQQSSKQIGELRTDFELKVLFPEVIKYNNLPTEWLDTHGEKPEVHTAALANALDIAYKIRNYAAAIQVIGLHTAEGSRPAIPFPPHCAPEGEYGKLEKLRVDWPKTPGVNGESAKFWEDCKDWLEKYGAEVEKELYAWADGNKNPEHVLFYGEVEGEVAVSLDGQGKMHVSKVDEKTAEQGKKVANLLAYDFETSTNADGTISLRRSVSARNAYPWNVYNIGAPEVGQSSTTTRLQPTDCVAIYDNWHRVHVVRAADLDSWKATQLAAYWGHKSALVAMDVGMLVGGISSCGTSYALYKAGEITAEQLALRAGHGALRAVLGASGVFLNSAAAHTDPFWREVSKYRGYTIIADVGLGTAMSVGNKVLGLSETAEAKAFHDAVKATMDQAHPVWKGLYYFTEGASPFQPGMHNLYHWPMMLSQGYFGVTVSHDIWNQMDAIAHSQEENPYLDALIKIQGGRDVSTLPDNVQALLGVHQNKEMTATLDFYKKCLIEGEDVSSARAREITSMFDRCREIVLRQPPEDAQQADLKRFEEQRGGDIEKLKSELLVHVFGDGSKVADEIAAAEKNKTRSPDAAVKKLTVGGLDQKSKVAALVAIFMMTAASQKSGLRDDQVISQRKVQLPSHPVLEYRGEEYDVEARRPPRPIWVTVEDKRSVRQELTMADLEEMLKPTLHKGNPQERFVTANVLTMSGERNQFALAGTLCTLLNDKNANSATKSCVLTELSLIIGAIKHTEATTGAQQLSEYQAESWGLSSKGLEQVLSSFAGDPSNDRRLRLLAAAQLHNLRQHDLGSTKSLSDLGALLRSQCASSLKQLELPAGEVSDFEKHSLEKLRRDLSSENLQERINSILTLGTLKDMGEFSDNKGRQNFNDMLVKAAELAITQSRPLLALKALDVVQPGSSSELDVSTIGKLQSILKQPTTDTNASVKALIIERMPSFLTTAEQRSQFAEACAKLIDKSSTTKQTTASPITIANQTYGADFPELRTAAVSALAKLGAPQYAPLIASLLESSSGRQSEPDAEVRLAAWNALAEMRYPDLTRRASDWFAQEADLAVRRRALQICSSSLARQSSTMTPFEQRLNMEKLQDELAEAPFKFAPKNPQQRERFWQNQEGLVKQGNDGISVPDSTRQRNWNEYWSDVTTSNNYSNPCSMSAKFFNTPNVTSEEYVAFWDEFHHIVDQAGQSITDEKTVLARFGLYDLVKKYGQQFRNKDVAGRDKALNMSMDCLLSLVHPGNTGWTDSLKMVREILNDTSQPVERRLKIVASLHEKMLAKGALRDSALPSFQSAISTVLAGALEAECRAPDIPKEQTQKFQYDRREEFRLKLLASLKDAQSLQMLPRAAGFHIVEAMSGLADDPRSTLPFPRFRKECRDFVTDLRYSVLTLSAVADGRADDSSLNKRAQSIKDALAQNTGGNPLYSGADASLMLFRACCGAGLTNPSDPRKTPLYQALLSTPLDEKTLDPAKSLDEASIVRQDHAQMVSLSAAILILDRRNHAFSDEDKRRASETIAYLAAHGARFGIRRDAKRVIDEGLASQPQNATPAGGLRPGATADPRLGK